jgi:glyoxylase-like metal-dependent hydrolase (beta-lactamase superfamily II)
MSGASTIEVIEAFDVVRIKADNPSLLTLDGTNTWVLGRDPAWIVDPGPALDVHLDAIAEVAAARGGAGGIALTHGHVDHTEGVEALRERLGGVSVGPGPLEVVPVPGHSDDHVALLLGDVCCTGDAVLGEGSVFVAGDMAGYLEALARLRERGLRLLCPGHGPPVLDPDAKLAGYIGHRLDRERRLVAALDAGLRADDDLLGAAWADAPAVLRPASLLTMRSHLRKLEAEGRLPPGLEVPAPGELPAI